MEEAQISKEQPQELPIAEQIAKLKADNDLLEAEKLRREKLRQDLIIGGKAEMSKPTPAKTKNDELNEILKGTAIRLK